VGVPGDRYGRDGVAFARVSLGVPRRSHLFNVFTQFGNAVANAASVKFYLGFTWATAPHTGSGATNLATGLTGHGFSPATQTRQEVFQLGQLNLSLAFTRLGMLGKNIQDQRGAVNYFDLDDVFKAAALRSAKFSV